MNVKTFAAIDIGSYETAMKIFEFSGKNRIKEIDCIRKNLDLGSDTFSKGKLSNHKVDDLCKVLEEFAGVMKAYQVDSYRAYGTSAIREAENVDIVIDRVAQRTHLTLETLSNSEQRFLDYKSVASKDESFRRIIEEKTAIVDIGGGSIQLSLFDNDTLVSTQNLKLGVLRIQELLQPMNAKNTQLEKLIEELITEQLETYRKLYLKDREIQNIIIIDDYISPWAVKHANRTGKQLTLEAEDFGELMTQLRTKSTSQLAEGLDITEDKVPLVVISAVLAKNIAYLMGAKRVWAPGVTLCDGAAYEYGEKIKMFRNEHDFEKDITACALNISKRYMGGRKKSENLEEIACTIFDSMKRVHGLGKREKLYLKIAAILHDCGKYISMVNIGENSYNIIMATEIIGLSHMERMLVANIVRYNHTEFVYCQTAH